MSYLTYCIFKYDKLSLPNFPNGVANQPVFPIIFNDLCAATSKAPTHTKPLQSADIMAYQSVVETIHAHQAVLPMRYGCIFSHTSGVVNMLSTHYQHYVQTLSKLKDCAEMCIRILTSEPHATSPKAPPASATGTSYLLNRKAYFAQQDNATEQDVVKACQNAFANLYVEIKTETPATTHPIFKAKMMSLFFLVPRLSIEDFQKAYRTFSQTTSAKTLLSGPWPPYNFIPETPFDLPVSS